MIPLGRMLANVDAAMNAIEVRGDAVGPTLYYGAGAGEMPTASAVVADLMEIARELQRGGAGPVAPLSYLPHHLVPKPSVALDEQSGRFYLRFTVADELGVLAEIAGALGENGVGIESVVQKGNLESETVVPIIVLTHRANEAALRDALARMDELQEVKAPTLVVRIEEEV
jgi:homoserine dehydrogenase